MQRQQRPPPRPRLQLQDLRGVRPGLPRFLPPPHHVPGFGPRYPPVPVHHDPGCMVVRPWLRPPGPLAVDAGRAVVRPWLRPPGPHSPVPMRAVARPRFGGPHTAAPSTQGFGDSRNARRTIRHLQLVEQIASQSWHPWGSCQCKDWGFLTSAGAVRIWLTRAALDLGVVDPAKTPAPEALPHPLQWPRPGDDSYNRFRHLIVQKARQFGMVLLSSMKRPGDAVDHSCAKQRRVDVDGADHAVDAPALQQQPDSTEDSSTGVKTEGSAVLDGAEDTTALDSPLSPDGVPADPMTALADTLIEESSENSTYGLSPLSPAWSLHGAHPHPRVDAAVPRSSSQWSWYVASVGVPLPVPSTPSGYDEDEDVPDALLEDPPEYVPEDEGLAEDLPDEEHSGEPGEETPLSPSRVVPPRAPRSPSPDSSSSSSTSSSCSSSASDSSSSSSASSASSSKSPSSCSSAASAATSSASTLPLSQTPPAGGVADQELPDAAAALESPDGELELDQAALGQRGVPDGASDCGSPVYTVVTACVDAEEESAADQGSPSAPQSDGADARIKEEIDDSLFLAPTQIIPSERQPSGSIETLPGSLDVKVKIESDWK